MSAPHDPALRIDQAFRAGDVPRAAALALRWVQQQPGDARANHYAALAQHHAGNHERALHYARRAVELAPRDAARHIVLARLLSASRRGAEGVASALRAVELEPGSIALRDEAARMLIAQRRVVRSIALLREGLERSPDALSLRRTLVTSLNSAGLVEEALHAAMTLARDDGGDHASRGMACLISNYLDIPAADVLELHKDYGACVAGIPRPRDAARADQRTSSRVRIGLLSPDLRAHSVTYFLGSLLEHLDRSAFEVHAFHTNGYEDDTTARLRKLCDSWWMRNDPEPLEVLHAVRARPVDIMLDLAGHTSPKGLLACALRLAPVQATFIGYPNTTGLREMDYRIADSCTDPPGAGDRLATEQLVRMDPHFLCYQPPADAPPVRGLPDGETVFVSFNALQKITPTCARLWARVLERMPGSRLLLKMANLVEPELREDVLKRLESWGLSRARTEVLPATTTTREHLETYARAHIALDTYPYHGTTTTCEAMWMGVPVVTLVGDRHASRVGLSLLRAVGAGEWAAHSEEEFIANACGLAKDRASLASARAGLRERVAKSALCDGAAYARRFERVVRQMLKNRSEART